MSRTRAKAGVGFTTWCSSNLTTKTTYIPCTRYALKSCNVHSCRASLLLPRPWTTWMSGRRKACINISTLASPSKRARNRALLHYSRNGLVLSGLRQVVQMCPYIKSVNHDVWVPLPRLPAEETKDGSFQQFHIHFTFSKLSFNSFFQKAYSRHCSAAHMLWGDSAANATDCSRWTLSGRP